MTLRTQLTYTGKLLLRGGEPIFKEKRTLEIFCWRRCTRTMVFSEVDDSCLTDGDGEDHGKGQACGTERDEYGTHINDSKVGSRKKCPPAR